MILKYAENLVKMDNYGKWIKNLLKRVCADPPLIRGRY